MFKTFSVGLVIIFLLVGPIEGKPAENGEASPVPEEKVVVYNWKDYIPDGVLDAFTAETGIKVEYSTYDNNEVMYTHLKLLRGRGYDVLVPSTHLVGRMRDEGLLQPLDKNKLEHFPQLDPALLNKSYDPNNEFSVPYLWGTTGIGIDTGKIDAGLVTSWADLWDARWRGRLLLTDDMREVFNMALRVDGHSVNTSSPDEIKQAYERLRRLMPNVKLLSSSPRDEFLSGKVDIGVLWNGDLAIAQQQKPSLQYIYPREGASFWVDSFVIPARAANVANAHKFIEYMLRPEVAARCVKELGYATANLTARNLLDKKLSDDPVIFPPADVLADAEFQQDVGSKAMELYRLYWDKLKVNK